MSSPITVAGVTLDIEQAGPGRPLLFLHPGEGLAAKSSLDRGPGARPPRDCPAPPGLRQLQPARLVRHGRRHRISVSRSRAATRPGTRGAGRRLLRRLDRRRNGGARHAPLRRPRAVGAAGDQGGRRARPRHRRHAQHPPRRIPPPRVGRSGEPAWKITRRCRTPNSPPSPAPESRSRCSAGSPICTIRD